ncbi:MAG: HD domain-containing phosphohydrolase [Coriobacteriia bacterium]
MLSRLFGKHLHNQIIAPLVIVAAIVGFIATLVAVILLSRVIDQWVDQAAHSTTGNVVARIQSRTDDLMRSATLAAENPRLVTGVVAGDAGRVTGELVLSNAALRADSLMVVDEDGRVLAVTGRLGVLPGQHPFSSRTRRWAVRSMRHPVLTEVAGRVTLTALQPVSEPGGNVHVLALSTVIDDAFLRSVSRGSAADFCFFGPSGKRVACTVESSSALRSIMEGLDLPAREAIAASRRGGSPSADLRVEGRDMRVWAQRVTIPGDPTGGEGYLVAFVRTDVSEQTRATTTRLILMWSVFAILVLVGLGWWVARRISDPLVLLTQSARRVADGDFSSRVEIPGGNELTQLAESFDQMTESLRNRTEVLTKKVLELATLYEISRSLGSTLDLDVLLDSVLDSTMRIFNIELGYVTLRDKETSRISLRAWRGPGQSQADERAVRSSMAEWVIREGRPLIFNPPASGEGQQVDTVSGALAALCVPLISGEGTVGAITVGTHDRTFRFSSDDVRLLSTIANHVTIAVGNIDLFSSLQEAYLATVRSLAAAVDAKDPYTRGHSDKVATYAMAIAERLELSTEQRTALEMAAYLHDIGKIGIREEILLKPGRLSAPEMGQMRHHPLIGANILRPVAFPWPIAPVVRHHHEHWDGSGYPAGLKGEEIPLLARILTVADAYEAMTADRPYRPGRSREEAIVELRRCSGSHFDPRVAEAFISVLEESPGEIEFGLLPETEDVQPDEARAIFVAICDGMVNSFRRLGGPRLATNLEAELNAFFGREDLPYSFESGHLYVRTEAVSPEAELAGMRATVHHITASMERTSGRSLVDHFYQEALTGLSERMRVLARVLDLYVSV